MAEYVTSVVTNVVTHVMTNLREEHLATAEQVPHYSHSVQERTLYNLYRLDIGGDPVLLHIGYYVLVDT